MRHKIIGACLALFTMASVALGFEATGKIKRVDADNGVLYVFANGQDRTVKIAKSAKVLGTDGKDLADGLKAKELNEGSVVTLTIEPDNGTMTIMAIRLGGQMNNARQRMQAGGANMPEGKPTTGLKPLTEMSAKDNYKGEDGGLYGGGSNEPPMALQAAAQKKTAQIVPRDSSGKFASDGKIVLVSISMSNATMEFSAFKRTADDDSDKSPLVTIVDCAQGGQAMAQWVDPQAKAWVEADRRLEAAGVTHPQVQVAWIKLANVRPTGELQEHGKKLQQDTQTVIQNARARFPNLAIVYLSNRIYAGYAGTPLNPEPYAYESAFAVRWLIQDQLKSSSSLDSANAPLLLWGPYLWGDGVTPRKADGLVWNKEDLAGDGTHPSSSGVQKVVGMLLTFFKTDPYAKTWFVKK